MAKMITSLLSKYSRCYKLLSARSWSQFQCLSLQRQELFTFCGSSTSHRKMIGMRRGLWGKVTRQNQAISRETGAPETVASVFRQDRTTAVASITTDQMLAAEEIICPPSSKRAKIEAVMPTNTLAEAPVLRFKRLSEHAKPPKRGSELAAGYDLHSAEDCEIPAQGKRTVMTDIQIELPEGCYGRVAPRSGLAHKNHIDVGAGVIDRDYRGNVGVVMFNLSKTDFKVEKGERIAQLICERIFYPELEEVEELSETKRGSKGYGSSGTK